MTPLLLDRFAEREVMSEGGTLMVAGVALGALAGSLGPLMALWTSTGLGFALTQTPIGRLLVRSAQPEDCPAVHAAQFALTHAAWRLAYPLAGQFGAWLDLDGSFLLMTSFGVAGLAVAWRLWPPRDPEVLPHSHPNLLPDHPHLALHRVAGGHPFRIDRLHRH